VRTRERETKIYYSFDYNEVEVIIIVIIINPIPSVVVFGLSVVGVASADVYVDVNKIKQGQHGYLGRVLVPPGWIYLFRKEQPPKHHPWIWLPPTHTTAEPASNSIEYHKCCCNHDNSNSNNGCQRSTSIPCIIDN